jgi:C_GCAxxG_C_C family probable redox protein
MLCLRNFNAGDKSRTFQNHIKRVTPFSFIFLIFLKKTQMEKKEKAIRYFREGYNCSQAVLLACAGESETGARVSAAFGGGMGRLQKTCGAVTGAYIYFGMKYGSQGLPAENDKIRVYDRVKRFNRMFVERNGTDLCSELLGEDLNTPEGKAKIREKDLHSKVCEKCISDSIDIIEQIK